MDVISENESFDMIFYKMINGCFVSKAGFIFYVLTWIIICIGIPLIIVAIVAVYFLIRKGHISAIYIMNLFISDLIQLYCMRVMLTEKTCANRRLFQLYYFGEMASVGFMVCVCLERCLCVAFPQWYRYRQTIKSSVVVCAVIWVLPLFYVLPSLWVEFQVTETIYVILHLVALCLFLFFLVGTLTTLSSARSVPSDEKRRIVAILVVVLLNYSLLFLPDIMWSLVKEARNNNIFTDVSFFLLQLSPLADLTLYIFIRKG